MDESEKKRWLLKDREGRVRGPFFTDEILSKISQGEFTGEEMIALYPSTNWIPISKDPQFYDQLLNALYNDSDTPAPKTSEQVKSESIQDVYHRSTEAKKPPPPKSRVERVSTTQKKDATPPPHPPLKAEKKPAPQKIIELKNVKKVLRKAKIKKTSVPFFLVLIALVATAGYFMSGYSVNSDQIHLLAPRKNQQPMSEAVVKEKVQRALGSYIKDSFSDYMRAQETLVQVLEGDPRNLGALSLTCLTYFELWPFSYQDSQDLAAVSIATQMASKVDPAGVEAATCRTVDLLVHGRHVEAKGLTEMVLDTFGRSGQPPLAFYYFKAYLFESDKDYESAISYARSAEQLWPQWLRVYALEASASVKAKKFNEAANIYRNILKNNPSHKASRIQLGLIEFSYLRNYQEGQQLLEVAMKQDEKVPHDILSQGYLGLAEMALQHQDQASALIHAQKAFAMNSTSARAKEIILSIGGEKKLRETKILDSQLVFEGDQLVREGDCNAAQAHYRAAYESNKKNGLAAMKAAECLWQLSLTTEATQWLDTAIRSDPKLMDAYILLADYYSQRFNYSAAGQILSKAKSQAPNSYKVFRGYALVELRRNNFQGAVNYAQKAIQLYEADVESYIILAQALMNTAEYSKAFEASNKAIEIDLNNREAQIGYAKTLAAVRGANVGIDYLTRLVSTYPTITEYRVALGDLYLKDQSYTLAQQVFEQVVKFAEKPKRAYLLLGQTYQKQKLYEEAKNAYFKAASLDPADVEPLFLAGQLYLELKQPSEARVQFQRVLRINKDYPLVNYFIGKSALQLGSTGEALEQANLEKIKNPNLAEPYLLAAESYTEMKQYSDCAGEYQKAVKLWSGGAEIYIKLARCFRMSGNIDAALSMINQAGTQESGNPEVWKEQGVIYEVRQESVKAIEAYSQYLILAPNAVDRQLIEGRINALSH